METVYRSRSNVVFACRYHIVWCSKYRRKVLVDDVAKRLLNLVSTLCKEMEVDIVEMETMPDHVHLLVDIDPRLGVHKLVKRIKGVTSRLLRQEFCQLTTKLPTLWTNSYFVATVGNASLEIVKRYIEEQKTSQRR